MSQDRGELHRTGRRYSIQFVLAPGSDEKHGVGRIYHITSPVWWVGQVTEWEGTTTLCGRSGSFGNPLEGWPDYPERDECDACAVIMEEGRSWDAAPEHLRPPGDEQA